MKFKHMLVLLSIMFLFLSGCAPAAPEQGKDTLVVGMGGDAVSLDPHATNDQPSSRVGRQIYETLIVQTEDLQLVPGLATSW
ncbi:MAG: glutathione ABC transporter substrate-binding protein, partial [Firmicutes bacterium HGW-Firmicutes-20]